MYVVVARYYTKSGAEPEVLDHMRGVARLTQREPGCRAYIVNQSVSDPRNILLYEQYVDEDAFQAHLAAPYLEEVVRGKVWPLLESRERDVMRVVE
jgi:quinol monooxygenase YgiN